MGTIVPPLKAAQDGSIAKLRLHYLARQPILTADLKLLGYELLFRKGGESAFNSEGESASQSVISSVSELGFGVLCDGRRGFINCTAEILADECFTLLPASHAVVEILETVVVDDRIVAACHRLKAAGYTIALDDFAEDDPRERLIPLADIVKADLRASSIPVVAAMVKRYGSRNCRILAEKVETQEEFVAARDSGCAYFQGYFFCKPELRSTRRIPSNRTHYLRLLQAASRPDLDAREIESIIKQDASLYYRWLRYLNSSALGFRAEIRSVGHGLSLMGERTIRQWARLVATIGAGWDKPGELVRAALVRARFCELLATRIQMTENSDSFLIGLLSLMDVILEAPMTKVLEGIHLDDAGKAVLLGQPSPLEPLYRLVRAESGDWEHTAEAAQQLHLSHAEVSESYWDAIEWAQQIHHSD